MSTPPTGRRGHLEDFSAGLFQNHARPPLWSFRPIPRHRRGMMGPRRRRIPGRLPIGKASNAIAEGECVLSDCVLLAPPAGRSTTKPGCSTKRSTNIPGLDGFAGSGEFHKDLAEDPRGDLSTHPTRAVMDDLAPLCHGKCMQWKRPCPSGINEPAEHRAIKSVQWR